MWIPGLRVAEDTLNDKLIKTYEYAVKKTLPHAKQGNEQVMGWERYLRFTVDCQLRTTSVPAVLFSTLDDTAHEPPQ
jgi:hypothetical protein